MSDIHDTQRGRFRDRIHGDRSGRHHHDPRGHFGRGDHDHHGPHGGPGGWHEGRDGGPAFHHHGRGRGRGLRGGRGRTQRGDVRAAVLLVLSEAGPMHGYQLMQEIGERTNGAWQPSPGAIYPALSLLEDEGLVEITRDAGRKQVSLTEAGTSYIEANRDSLGDPFTPHTQGGMGEFRNAIGDLAMAFGQVAKSGTEEQQKAAMKVLTDAKRSIYLILAEES